MKTLYLECNMGAAGDMLTAALLELDPNPDSFIQQMNSLGLPETSIAVEPSVKCGIQGTHYAVRVGPRAEESLDVSLKDPGHTHVHGHEHGEDTHSRHGQEPHSHTHSTFPAIQHFIGHLPLPSSVIHDAVEVYRLLAEAEAFVHGSTEPQIHFHEVGAWDAVADIVGFCLLVHRLAPDRITASPVHVGSGQVRCAHGIVPVPAPATAYLLQGVPSYGGAVQGELCTPTGAALLRYFAKDFGPQPLMVLQKTGYGMGQKDFPAANCVRAFWGTQSAAPENQTVEEIACNLDDMTGEDMGYIQQLLLEEGALDAYFVPILMKKSRPAQMLCCLCAPEKTDHLTQLILQHTTSWGVRIHSCARRCLPREITTIPSAWGPVRLKSARDPVIEKSKYEYEDLAAIAKETGLSLAQVRSVIRALE